MIELSLLGLHALRGPDGRELGTLPAQPKRFALLAFLAIGATGGYHRRDTLAAMFWPDLDQFAARRALRNTLYHLRDALGDGVIVTQGDDAVAIDPARLTCDVTRLGEAVEAGRYEEAVELYRGELLAGMHFANAGEAFEEWLSRERARVVEMAMRSLRALAEREEKTGNSAAAAMWAQRACALVPGDESWHRRAMSLLDRAGDTGGALRLHEAYARRLRAEFNAVPSAETESLAARIRAGGGGGGGQQQPAARAAPDQLSATEAAPMAPLSTIGPEPSARRRRIALTAAAIAAAAIAIVLAVRATSATHSGVAAARQRVLVEVFDNRTGDAGVQSLGRMAQDWIAQGLLRTELVDVVDPRAVYVQTHLVGGGAADPATLARHTGATVLVSGSYFRTGDTLFFDAAVTNARTGRVAGVVGPILSSARNPVAGLDELRSRVMSAVATAVEVRATMDIRGPEVPPFDVYRDYVDGWDAFWHGDGLQAEKLFLRSARGDTLFTPAVLAAAMTGSNRNHCTLSDSLAHVLATRSRPLDRKDRLTVQIIDARCRGKNEEMLRLTLERAKLDPASPGNLTSAAAAASWANRPGVQLELLKRIDPTVDLAWSTDSTHVAYWTGLTSALHSLGRHREELAVTDRMAPGAPLTRIWIRATALAALSRPTAALALLDSALTLPVETANDIGLAPYTDGRPEYTTTPAWIAWWVGCELAVHGDSVAARQAAQRAVAWYRSRPPEERATFEERLVAAWSLEMAGSRVEAEAIARQLLQEDTTNVDVQAELAGLAAERGDVARADSIDRWLAAQPVSQANWSALIYRARVAALLGRLDSAVALTRQALDAGAWPGWIHREPAFVPLHGRPDFVALTAPKD
jgi:DNA-binding SARP family transcriptional activator/tetratricopeptide (TPR) repeat protein